MITTVTSKGQTVVPARIRKAYGIGLQTKLEWIDDGMTIRVVPLPVKPVQAAKGSTQGLHTALLKERRRERSR